MSEHPAASLDELLETLALVPVETWYKAALKAKPASDRLPPLSTLWQAADQADAVRAWDLADSIETLYCRLDNPATLQRIGGRGGCELVRRTTELAVLGLGFPGLLTPTDTRDVAEPFLVL